MPCTQFFSTSALHVGTSFGDQQKAYEAPAIQLIPQQEEMVPCCVDKCPSLARRDAFSGEERRSQLSIRRTTSFFSWKRDAATRKIVSCPRARLGLCGDKQMPVLSYALLCFVSDSKHARDLGELVEQLVPEPTIRGR